MEKFAYSGTKVLFVTPKGVLPLAMCHASATHEGP
jgi:hypothetical protein